MDALKNFNTATEALFNASPSDRAIDFLQTIVNKIAAKGEAWIAANAVKLHITDAEVADDAACPVSDNRLYYIAAWQDALAA